MIEEEGLAENAARLGEVLREELSSLDPAVTTTVRGRGLLFAVVIDPQGGEGSKREERRSFVVCIIETSCHWYVTLLRFVPRLYPPAFYDFIATF